MMLHILNRGGNVKNRRNHRKAVERVSQHGAVPEGYKADRCQYFQFRNEADHKIMFFLCQGNQSQIKKYSEDVKRNQYFVG